MTRLSWGDVGARLFEAGVERGVLYVGSAAGVVWNGLVKVSEEPTGGEIANFYFEGVKHLRQVSVEEFEATIEAYTYPDAFSECDGTAQVSNGLFATQQRRKPFGFCYRTNIGNDVDGLDHGYKLHIVYDALASPASHTNNSVGDSAEADNFSWKITTRPPEFSGRRRSAHLVIDSRKVPAGGMATIEDILYGTATKAPRLPVIPELVYIFESFTTTFFSAGSPIAVYYATLDGGIVPEAQISTVDGGMP